MRIIAVLASLITVRTRMPYGITKIIVLLSEIWHFQSAVQYIFFLLSHYRDCKPYNPTYYQEFLNF